MATLWVLLSESGQVLCPLFLFGGAMGEAEERIERLVGPILGSLGLSLWDLEYRKQGPRWLLRVFIDRGEEGVSLDDCERVSRDLAAALDVEDLIPHAYTLEVSSPGLDRSLTRPEHYARFTGKLAKIKTFRPLEGQKVFRGRIAGAVDDKVTLDLEEGGSRVIPLAEIASASLIVEW